MLEGGSVRSNSQKNFGTQTAWIKFLEPAVNVAAPFLGMAISAKTRSPKIGKATTSVLKISGGKI